MAAYDVIVVGGGHNGLVAAGYLARAGRRVLVLERRDTVGGAAVSEHPFGPDFTVTTLSYVVSLLPADMVRDLRLVEHGYHVYPQGPYFAPRADGRYLALPDDPAQRHREISQFSARDADAYERWDAWLAHLGRLVGPLLHEIPPKLGSKRPRDLAAQVGLAGQLRHVDVRAAFDLTRLFTASIADLVEDRFESDAMRGLLSVSGVIGTWAGPRSAGTGFVTLHHHLDQTGGQQAGWGFPRGGMGGVTQAMAAAARSFGAEIRTSSPVARIDTRDGAAIGVTLADGTELRAPTVITTAHPRISFLELLDRAELPADFVADIEAWRSRSGTVKVNFAVDRLPTFASHPEYAPGRARRHDRARRLARRNRGARSRRRSAAGRPRCRSPTSASRRCSTRPSRPRASTSSARSPSGCRTPTPPRRTPPSSTRTPTAWSPAWRRSRPGSPTRSSAARSSVHTRWSRSTAWSAATSSTAS